jgi:hypothetical protein
VRGPAGWGILRAMTAPSLAGRPVDDRPLDRRLLGLAGLAGLVALAVGLDRLSDAPDFALRLDRVLPGVASVAATTVPAAVAVALAWVVSLISAGVVARWLLRRPAAGAGDWLLSAFATAILRDAVLLGVLGGTGWFRGPVVAAIDLITILAGLRLGTLPDPRSAAVRAASRAWLADRRRGLRPWGGPALPLALLVAVAWMAPVVLQLGSPVVPFIDVLPNHVAPVEHLRTFGSFDPLTTAPSPIYGPSRTFLGYVAFFGAVDAIAGVPAGLAAAAAILPLVLLLAVATGRLARRVGGPGAVPFALLLMGMTTAFARVADVRATVVALPIVLWVAEGLVGPVDDAEDEPPTVAMMVAVGLAAAILVHPLMGALVTLSVGLLAAARPDRLGRMLVPGLVAALLAGLPQAATMLGVEAAPPALAAGVVAAAFAASGVVRAVRLHRPGALLARWCLLIGAGLVVGYGVAGAGTAEPVAGLPVPGTLEAVRSVVTPLVLSSPVALIAVGLGLSSGTVGTGSRVLLTMLAVGLAAGALVALVPLRAGDILALSLRYEVPKTLFYWVGPMLAIAGAAGLDAFRRHTPFAALGRGAALAGILVLAAAPIRPDPIDAVHLGERRLAELVAFDLQGAGLGYWQGFPDSRAVVDAPRRELLAMVRARIDAGEIGPSTPILHVAASFQQWVATPLGVFTGVTETMVSPDAEPSIHTVGGRLEPFALLPDLLVHHEFPFVLLEPADLPAEVRDTIVAAGYVRVDGDPRGELFRLGP